jgi:MoxR-like ATPase
MPVTDSVVNYAVTLARKTRPGKEGGSSIAENYFSWGAGPRASQNLVLAAKALAMMKGEGTPSTAHVKQIAPAVLRHRVVINYKAKGEGLTVDDLIGQLL